MINAHELLSDHIESGRGFTGASVLAQCRNAFLAGANAAIEAAKIECQPCKEAHEDAMLSVAPVSDAQPVELDLLAAARSVVAMTYSEARDADRRMKPKLYCQRDKLNPCWDNRSDDVPGQHWGGGPACHCCNLRAAVSNANRITDTSKLVVIPATEQPQIDFGQAAWLLNCYAEFIKADVPSTDIERHPYLPEIEDMVERLRAAAKSSIPASAIKGQAS